MNSTTLIFTRMPTPESCRQSPAARPSLRAILWLCIALATATGAQAAERLSPRQLLENADRARGKLPGLVWEVQMTSRERGQERTQSLEVKARGNDVLATFLSPPRVKNQKLLIVGRNMWFMKPDVSKPVPISPRQKLMGQAANGDIASTDYAGDYAGIVAGEEKVDGVDCFVLVLQATQKNVTYDKITYWVSKDRQLGLKAEFYTVSGKRLKTATFEYRNIVVYQRETIPFVSTMRIQDALRPKEVTVLEYSNIRVQDLPDHTFNLNLLMR